MRIIVIIQLISNNKVFYVSFDFSGSSAKIKENKAHIFLTESYLMLQVQTIDG